jgi:hypothetical protein
MAGLASIGHCEVRSDEEIQAEQPNWIASLRWQ